MKLGGQRTEMTGSIIINTTMLILNIDKIAKSLISVITSEPVPVKTGIQNCLKILDALSTPE